MKTLFVTEQQKYLAYRAVIFRVASSLGVKNLQQKSNHELFTEIKDSQSPLLDPMFAYFVAYNNWFDYKKNAPQPVRKRTVKDLAGVETPVLQMLERIRISSLKKFERECELLEA